MSELGIGSTVGGYPIITEANKDNHFHNASAVTDLGTAAFATDGVGSGLNVQYLDGKSLTDLDNAFVNTNTNDTMTGELILTGSITQNLQGATKSYADASFSNKFKADINIPILSVSNTNIITSTGNTTISIASGSVFVMNKNYSYSTFTIDISTLFSTLANNTYYVYLYLDTGTNAINYSIDTLQTDNSYTKINIGSVTFNSSSVISSVNNYDTLISFNNKNITIAPINKGIPFSDSSGALNSQWFDPQYETVQNIVSLNGATVVKANNSYNYTITDFDSFSTYSFNSSLGTITQNNDTLTLNVPANINYDGNIDLTISKNNINHNYSVKLLGDKVNLGLSYEIFNGNSNINFPVYYANDICVDSTTQTLYMFGGLNSSNTLTNDFYSYSLIHKGWSQITTTTGPTARKNHTIVFNNNYVYVIGGIDASNNYLNEFWSYNKLSNTWFQKPNIPNSLANHKSILINNKIYVIGGENSNGLLGDMYIFDITANSWSTSTSLPNTSTRKDFGITEYNNKIYVYGGNGTSSNSTSNDSILNDLLVYDISSNAWSFIDNSSFKLEDVELVSFFDKLYILGGVGSTSLTSSTYTLNNSIYYYDLTSSSWNTESISTNLNINNISDLYRIKSFYNDGLIYLFGSSYNATSSSYISYDYLFDEANKNLINNISNYPTTSITGYSFNNVNDKLYLTGPYNTDLTTSNIFEYNFYYKSWELKSSNISNTSNNFFYKSSSCVIGDKIYYYGGENSNGVHSNFVVYDTTNDTFTNLASANLNLIGHKLVTDGNSKIYLIGGWDNNSTYNTNIMVYDINSNSWGILSPISYITTGLVDFVAEFYNNKIYIHGGWDGSTSSTFNNIISYDVLTDQWSMLISNTSLNVYSHTSTIIGTRIFLYGGINNINLYQYLIDTNELKYVSVGPYNNTNITDIQLSKINNDLYFYGGLENATTRYNSLWKMSN